MKAKDAKRLEGQLVNKKAPGMSQGYTTVRILDCDPTERTAWGKGTVRVVTHTYRDDDKPTKYALSQIELYDEGGE